MATRGRLHGCEPLTIVELVLHGAVLLRMLIEKDVEVVAAVAAMTRITGGVAAVAAARLFAPPTNASQDSVGVSWRVHEQDVQERCHWVQARPVLASITGLLSLSD